MVSVDAIEKESKKLICELDSDETKNYLNKLIRKYYLCYINNDFHGMDSIKNKINEVMVIYSNDDDLKHYFNYCLCVNSNIIIKSILKKDGDLLDPYNVVDEKKLKRLNERMQESVEYFKAIESDLEVEL